MRSVTSPTAKIDGDRGAVVGIDLDLALFAHLDAGRFEAEARRCSACGRWRTASASASISSQPVMRDVERAVVAPLDLLDRRIELEVDALAQRDLDQPVDDLLVVVAQDHVGPVDQRHMASELVEDAGELVGDIAAAGDHDPLRQLLEVEDLVGADRMLDALDRGITGRRAGRDQDLVGA